MQVRSLAVLLIPALAIAPGTTRPAFVAAETERIRTHLATVESELRHKDVSALTSPQRAARARNLDVLHEYWVRGVFPVNADFPDQRVPYFIDGYGTRCAMAYLIEQSGYGAFVARIAATRNNARIRELKDDAELIAWLHENGLTVAEAARIQPGYSSPFGNYAGTWIGTVIFDSKDSVGVPYVVTVTANGRRGTLAFPNRDPLPLRLVTAGGDSLVTEAGPVPSPFGSGRIMTLVRATVHYGGNALTGTVEARYSSGEVVRGRTDATLECPGPAAPNEVVIFIRSADLPKWRCTTETGTVLAGQATVFKVTWNDWTWHSGFSSRMAVNWHGRVGWIVDNWTRDSPFFSEPEPVVPSPPGTFRVQPEDTLLVTPAFLRGMTTLGLRFTWIKTLLRTPDVPRFVPAGLIATLADTTDSALGHFLVSAPPIARDPEFLAALALLPVPRDSWVGTATAGGSVFVTTGYAQARNTADEFLWKQSLRFIASPSTPPGALLTIVTWTDRHALSCPGQPPLIEVLEASLVRATRDNDRATLAALAQIQVRSWCVHESRLAPFRARASAALRQLHSQHQ